MSLNDENSMVMPVQPMYGYGYGGGCGGMMNGWGGDWAWIILLLLLGWGNNGWGNGYGGNALQGALTRGDLCMDMNFNDLQNAVRSGAAENNSNFRTIDNAVCTLGYNNAQLANGLQTQIANEFRGMDNAICTLGYQNQQGFNQLGSQFSNCCCDIRQDISNQGNTLGREVERGFCQTNFNLQQQNCQTLQAIDKVGDRVIDFLSNQENQRLRDEVAQYRDRANSQYVINEVTNTIRPCPIPSYPTCNPWATSHNGYNNGCCGCAG